MYEAKYVAKSGSINMYLNFPLIRIIYSFFFTSTIFI